MYKDFKGGKTGHRVWQSVSIPSDSDSCDNTLRLNKTMLKLVINESIANTVNE